MKLRRLSSVSALALAAALALTACGGDDSPNQDGPATIGDQPTQADIDAVNAVVVEGDAGAEPTLTFNYPLNVSARTSRLLDRGTGAPLEDGQQLSIQFVLVNGTDGERFGSTWVEGEGQTDTITLGDPALGIINDVLTGANVGARALIANPMPTPDGRMETSLMLIEVVDARNILTRAEGRPVTPEPGLPTVTLDADGAPSIEFPPNYNPGNELIVQTLIEGNGAVVRETDSITAHYTGWTLDDQVFDSSWARHTPAWFPLQNVIPGWTQGLTGQTVGSQVLLIIPPAMAYGEDEGAHPLGGQTLVFVVDILAVG